MKYEKQTKNINTLKTLFYSFIFVFFVYCDTNPTQKNNQKIDTLTKNVKLKNNQNVRKTIFLKDFFEKHIRKNFKDAKIITDSIKNNFLAFEESSPPTSEIFAMVYGNMAIWAGEKRDIIGFFYYALVEGSANLSIENMVFYDVEGNIITKEVLNLDFIKQEMDIAIPEKEKMGFINFKDFFVEIPENGTKLIFQLTNGEKLAEGEKTFANYLYMNWNKKIGKFEKVKEEYPEGE